MANLIHIRLSPNNVIVLTSRRFDTLYSGSAPKSKLRGERIGHVVKERLVAKQPNGKGRLMGWFGNDWNVIAIIFERRDLYRVNGQRGKGGDATKCRDGAKNHDRTIYWAVYDQKRAFVEGGPGKGESLVPADVLLRLRRELSTNATVTSVLGDLERKEQKMTSKPLAFGGYPKSLQTPGDDE